MPDASSQQLAYRALLRLVLNLKSIPYRTEWLSYPSIEPTFKSLGVKPTGTKLMDGTPRYTCPAITDPTSPTPTRVSDSFDIAVYLEDAYPSASGPKLFPEGTMEEQVEFMKLFEETATKAAGTLIMPETSASLFPECAEWFERSRQAVFGSPLSALCPQGSAKRTEILANLHQYLDKIAEIYDSNTEGGGEYFYGKDVTYADVFVVAHFLFWKAIPCGREGADIGTVWNWVEERNGGKWKRMLERFEPFLQDH
ncbi:hypothetical protein FRB99_004979 [Tulasnella sp. 403]|nr:hypothetical protein FRB99_004979 [Tulasnella sp. 403]